MALLRTGEAQEGGECHLPSGSAASCVDISRCSHLNKLIANLQRPFPGDVTLLISLKKPLDPVVPSMVRSSFLCGAEEVEGRTLPKICCPSAALAVKKPAEPTNVHLSHPAMRQLADPEKCGIAT